MPTSHLPALFPAEFPVISAPLMGKHCRERHKGLWLKQPELWLQPLCFLSQHNGNLGIFHWIIEKEMAGNMACTRNHRKMYIVHLCTFMCEEKHACTGPLPYTHTTKHTVTQHTISIWMRLVWVHLVRSLNTSFSISRRSHGSRFDH